MTNRKVDQSPTVKPRFFYGYIVVAIAFLVMVAIYSLPYSFGIFFKPMLAELRWTRAITSGAFSLSRIVAGLLSIAMGGLNDRFGPRIVITICGVLSGLGYLLMSQINTVWQLYLVYGVLIGAGTSIFVPLVSTVARWFVQRRTIMTGIVIAGLGVATLIGNPVANLLISAYDWRVSYIILGTIVAAIAILIAQFLRRDPTQVRQVAYGESKIAEIRPESENDAFTLREAVCTRQFWIFFALSICYSFCVLAVLIHAAPYITDIGMSATTAANILATMGGATIVGMIAIGNVGDRIGNKKTLIIGFILMSLALFLLLLAKETWAYHIFAIIFGLAYGGIAAQRSPMIAQMFGVRSHGLIFGVTDNSFTIGAAIGPVVTGYIFDLSGSYQMAFVVATVISIIGLILTIFFNPKITKSTRSTANNKL